MQQAFDDQGWEAYAGWRSYAYDDDLPGDHRDATSVLLGARYRFCDRNGMIGDMLPDHPSFMTSDQAVDHRAVRVHVSAEARCKLCRVNRAPTRSQPRRRYTCGRRVPCAVTVRTDGIGATRV